MELAKLILEYVKVLVWPAAAIGVVIGFRSEVKSLLAGIVNMRLPGGTEVSWGQLTPDQQKARAESEAREIAEAEASADKPGEIDGEELSDEDPGLAVRLAQDNRERDRKRERAALAEDLVIRQLESEFEGDFRRQATFHQRPDLVFDAIVFQKENHRVTVVEVKYINSRIKIEKIVKSEFDKVARLRRAADVEGVRALLVFVVDAEEEVREEVQQQASYLGRRSDGLSEIRVYGYDMIKQKFGA